MLIGLGYVAVFVLFFMVALKPQFDKISKLNTEETQKKMDVQELKNNVSPDNIVYKDLKIMTTKVDKSTKILFPSIIQEKIITIIDKQIKDSKINVDSINFSIGDQTSVVDQEPVITEAPTTSLLHQLVKTYAGEKIADKVAGGAGKPVDSKEVTGLEGLEKLSSAISYKGTYQNVIDILKAIENYPKRIIIKSINFSRDEKDELSGNINLLFYAFPMIIHKRMSIKHGILVINMVKVILFLLLEAMLLQTPA